MDSGEHLPVDCRPADAGRWEAPAEVCGTCSNFTQGRLVPVSFCPEAARKSAARHAYMTGGPMPDWLWHNGPDASSAVLR